MDINCARLCHPEVAPSLERMSGTDDVLVEAQLKCITNISITGDIIVHGTNEQGESVSYKLHNVTIAD